MNLTDKEKIQVLHASLSNIGRLLPEGMEIVFYREEGGDKTYMEVTAPTGETTCYGFVGHGPIYKVPQVELSEMLKQSFAEVALGQEEISHG